GRRVRRGATDPRPRAGSPAGACAAGPDRSPPRRRVPGCPTGARRPRRHAGPTPSAGERVAADLLVARVEVAVPPNSDVHTVARPVERRDRGDEDWRSEYRRREDRTPVEPGGIWIAGVRDAESGSADEPCPGSARQHQ